MAKIEEAPKIINEALYRFINKNVDYTLSIVEKRINDIQGKFFSYLVNSSGIIGTSGSFTLPGGKDTLPMPPSYPKFRKDYAASKRKGYENRFFINSGELKNSLRGLSATKLFGKPTVVFFQPGSNNGSRIFSSKAKGGYVVKSTRNFQAIQQLGTISIDFFPKIQTRFKTQYGPKFFKDFFGQPQSAPAGHKPVFIGMKLDNPQTKRPFIGQYMDWWVKVKAKQAVLKGIA